jgi:N-acetylneuraminic acid mutarotase
MLCQVFQLALALPIVALALSAWSSAAAMPTERAEVGAAELDGRIYVVGAYSGARDANEMYDPSSNSWQTRQPLPRELNHACAVGWGGLLFVVGGFDPTVGNHPVNSLYVYDPSSDSWSTRAPLPTPRGALACAVVAGKIYAIGGLTPAGDTGIVEAYDASTDSWSVDLAAMPTPRDHLACAVLDGQVHVIGGRSPALGLTASVHEVYDPAANTWSGAAALPTGRSGIGAAVLNGRIYVLGGEADHTFAENEAYDPQSDSWSTFAPMPTPRHGLGVVAVGDAIFTLGGGPRPGDSRSATVEVFRADSGN